MRFNTVIVAVVFGIVIISAPAALADSIEVGRINPPGINYCSGITFDGSVDPLTIDGFGDLMWRLDVTNAQVLSTHTLNGGRATTRGLEYDPTNGEYYTNRRRSGSNDELATVDPQSGAVNIIGLTGTGFNFLDQAVDPVTGKLWLITDINGGGLYSVNKTSGAGTLVRNYGGAMGQLSAMAVGHGGRLFVASINGKFYEIYADDPGVDFVTITSLSGADHFRDFEYSPITARWYGVEERRSASPREWHLREIIGLPGGVPCTGKEAIKKTKCKDKRGVNKLTVKLKCGVEGDTFTVKLLGGQEANGVLNRKGKGKAKFSNLPSGGGTATATWGCGAQDMKDYVCP